MYSIDVMISDHDQIQRMLKVIRNMCCGILEGAEVSDSDFRDVISFVRIYADKHHHGKEEQFLFPEMVKHLSPVADNLITHGMLVEHDLGRRHVYDLETALNQYAEDPKTEYKLSILTEAMGYAHLLQLHTEKENKVVYPFARRQLPQEILDEIDEKSHAFEEAQMERGIPQKYLAILERLEQTYHR